MWMPTHVQVTVLRAHGLLTKGKNNTNDCFVTIALGKTKFQTSVIEKAPGNVEWHEECELPIPDQGNTAEIILTVLHRNFLGVDEFLGRVAIPLNTLDIYERPKNRKYPLCRKPGKEDKGKQRGEIEVRIAFTVKSGSLTNLSKKEKHKSSIGHIAQSVGGSLLSLGTLEKHKGLKKFTKSIGSKMHLKGKKMEGDEQLSIGSVGSLQRRSIYVEDTGKSRQTLEDADPGVVSDDDEFTFDDLSHKSSGSSLNHSPSTFVAKTSNESLTERKVLPPVKPPRQEHRAQDEWESKLFGKQNKYELKPNKTMSLNRRSWDSTKLSSQLEEEEDGGSVETKEDSVSLGSNRSLESPKKDNRGMFAKLRNFRNDKIEIPMDKRPNSNERIIIGGENDGPITSNKISNELLRKFEGKTREDMILMNSELQSELELHKKKLKDLEDYLDDLLLRVMETTPRILQNPYVSCKLAHKKITG